MVKSVRHLGHVEAMEAGGREFSLHGASGLRAWDTLLKLWGAEGCESEPRPRHYGRVEFLIQPGDW